MTDENDDLRELLRELRRQHRELDENLNHLLEFKYVDQLQIQSLKRKKLKLKDQIARLESDLIPDQPA